MNNLSDEHVGKDGPIENLDDDPNFTIKGEHPKKSWLIKRLMIRTWTVEKRLKKLHENQYP